MSDIAISGHEFRGQEVLNDYINSEEKLFMKSLTVKIELFKKEEKADKTTIFDSEIKIVPNDEVSVLGNDHDVFNFSHIIFRLSCHGYTGFNCEYFKKEEEKLITDFYSGISICKDPIKCDSKDIPCDNNKYCKDHGTCFNNFTDMTQYCSCSEGWAGPTCKDRECAFDEEEYYFVIAKIVVKCKFQHNLGECLQYGDFMFCLCIRNEYTGENCEKQCDPKCEEGNNCTESENGTLYCYPSLQYLEKIYTDNPLTCKYTFFLRIALKQYNFPLCVLIILIMIYLAYIFTNILFSLQMESISFSEMNNLMERIKLRKVNLEKFKQKSGQKFQ
ncbi:hypothetical protein HZS_6327, partial [Henneguya salminicola]